MKCEKKLNGIMVCIFIVLSCIVILLFIEKRVNVLKESIRSITECNTITECSGRFGGESIVNSGWDVEENRKHFSFGSICTGRDGTLYAVFRGGYQHGVNTGSGADHPEMGGHILYSSSNDSGKSWSEPILFLRAKEGTDLRDITISYDSTKDCYWVVYTETSTDYKFRKIHILKTREYTEAEPFKDMIECSLPDSMPDSNQACHQVVRIGSHLFLPFYGRKNNDEFWFSGLLQGTPDGSSWKVLFTWNADNPDNSNECCLFTTFKDDGDLRMNMIFRGGNEEHGKSNDLDIAHYSYSDDGGVTWSRKESLGFSCAGGPKVYDINGTKMLLYRNQNMYENGIEVGVAAFSDNGRDWFCRTIISDGGPVYGTFTETSNNKMLLMYSKENGNDGHANLYIRRLLSVPDVEYLKKLRLRE